MNPAAPLPISPTSRSGPGPAWTGRPRRGPRLGAWRVSSRLSLRLSLRLASLPLALGLPLGCGQDPDAARSVAASPPTEARKIASLAPVATNLLLELERGDRIVAVDAESAKRPGLVHRPRVPETGDEAFQLLISLEPDLVVLPASRIDLSQRLAAANIRTIVVLIRSFQDGFTLFGELAGRVGLAAAARDRIAAASRPLAAIEAESASALAGGVGNAAGVAGATRPRVAVLASFEPLALVGDDQLATDLVEIAGGENVTDGRGPATIPIGRDALMALRPALLFHVRPNTPSAEERDALTASVPASLAQIAPLVLAEFDPDRFYAPEAIEAARTLREAIIQSSRTAGKP